MQNYVIIFHVGQTIEDTAEMNAAWGQWFGSMGDKVVDAGNPFDPANEASIKGGTVTMKADTVAGYTIVKAASLNEAIEMAKGCPFANVEGAWVNVHGTLPM
jgi:hypothetical protein